MAPDTPINTIASCFGSESTADAVKTQKLIPHVENTAVKTAPLVSSPTQSPNPRQTDKERRSVAGDVSEAHEQGHLEPARPDDLGEEGPVELALLELPAACAAPPLVHALSFMF